MATTVDAAFLNTTTRERDVRKRPVIAIGTKCPVTSMMPKTPAPLNSTPEWEWRTYDAPDVTGVIEGYVAGGSDSDYTNNIPNRAYLKGRFIKTWKNIRVTKEAQLMVNQFVVPTDPMQDNVVDKMIELHRNVEGIALKDQESVPPSAGATASVTRGIPRWISNSDGRFTDSATTPTATVRTPTGSIVLGRTADGSTLVEADIRNILTSIATTRQEDSTDFVAVCSPAARNAVTAFSMTDKTYTTTAMPVRRWNQQTESINSSIRLYKSDYGDVKLITSFIMDASVNLMLMLDMSMLEIKYAQAPMVTPLPVDGASQRKMLDAIFVVAMLNPQACGKVVSGSVY